jgi:RimJ/RimL family protein N-acetyltransferase
VADALRSLTSADLEHLELSAMGQADAEKLASWKYPGVYSFYDFSADPDDQAELLDPRRRHDIYFSARVPDCGLIGFAELKPQESGALEIGLGLRPECTGRGIGGRIRETDLPVGFFAHDASLAGAPCRDIQRARDPRL